MIRYKYTCVDEPEVKLLVEVARRMSCTIIYDKFCLTKPVFAMDVNGPDSPMRCSMCATGSCYATSAKEVASIGEMIKALSGVDDIKLAEVEPSWNIGCHKARWNTTDHALDVFNNDGRLVVCVPAETVQEIAHRGHEIGAIDLATGAPCN